MMKTHAEALADRIAERAILAAVRKLDQSAAEWDRDAATEHANAETYTEDRAQDAWDRAKAYRRRARDYRAAADLLRGMLGGGGRMSLADVLRATEATVSVRFEAVSGPDDTGMRITATVPVRTATNVAGMVIQSRVEYVRGLRADDSLEAACERMARIARRMADWMTEDHTKEA